MTNIKLHLQYLSTSDTYFVFFAAVFCPEGFDLEKVLEANTSYLHRTSYKFWTS